MKTTSKLSKEPGEKSSLKKRKKLGEKPTSKKSKAVEEYTIDPQKLLKYSRGVKVKTKKVKDRKLKQNLEKHEKKYEQAIAQAVRSEVLKTEECGYLETEGLERTHQYKQKDIAASVDITSSKKYFELKLEQFGPYKINYSLNGNFLLLGGQKGHLGAFNWQEKQLAFENNCQEAVRDVKWLHQETLFAAAQKKNVCIYDNTGTEIHSLKDHGDVNRLEYLPYHFLLATVGNNGYLKYQDTSTGKLITATRTKLGRCDCMSQNPYNAIINLGHANGTVTMWSPTVKKPLVKMLCHRGPVLSTATDQSGLYISTTGLDGLLKVWDVRTYKQIYTYGMVGRPASCVAISQKGMLAVGSGPRVFIFKDALKQKQSMPYMQHMLKSSQVNNLQFCPFEDVLGIGHTNGFTSLLIPGSGEPSFDALEVNPYQTKKQRQEHEVKKLLEKIQPEMITLNPNDILHIGKIEKETPDVPVKETAKAKNLKRKREAFEAKCAGKDVSKKFEYTSALDRFDKKSSK